MINSFNLEVACFRLRNSGTDCFLNATLNLLDQIAPLRINLQRLCDEDRQNPILRQLHALYHSRGDEFSTRNLRRMMLQQRLHTGQQDADDAMRDILDIFWQLPSISSVLPADCN